MRNIKRSWWGTSSTSLAVFRQWEFQSEEFGAQLTLVYDILCPQRSVPARESLCHAEMLREGSGVHCFVFSLIVSFDSSAAKVKELMLKTLEEGKLIVYLLQCPPGAFFVGHPRGWCRGCMGGQAQHAVTSIAISLVGQLPPELYLCM